MMESRMTRNCHVRFGERDEETRQSKDGKVRFVPTLFSPLLSNIALHGMETRIKQVKGASLIRYADDFVIFHEKLEKLKQCQSIIGEWLAQYDLEIKPSKTKVVNTLHEHDGNKPGFDFLGFNIRQYPVGKYQSGKNNKGKILGFKTLIKPSNNSIKTHYEKISDTCRIHNCVTQRVLVSKLTPIITGWCNYHKTVVSKETFSKLSKLTYLRLLRWAKRRHPNKNSSWIVNKYWITIGGDNWVFGVNSEFFLKKHSKVAIKRHVKVKGNKSPYDGDTAYWGSRMGKHPELKTSIAKLLKKQDGKCNWCNLPFQVEDIIETDHIIPKSIGGLDINDNLQLLHKHCHDSKTSNDLSLIKSTKKTTSLGYS
jgi:RNA-directed DNA polymerase